MVDADIVARELVAPGQAALTEIVASFGTAILAADGTLDRAALRERVFSDSSARKHLEQLLHPRIRESMRSTVERCQSAYALLAIPLLVEKGGYEWVNRVLVVDVPPALQRLRLQHRDGSSPEAIDAILATQADRDQRLSAADDVWINDGPASDLQLVCSRLHHRYLALAANAQAELTDRSTRRIGLS